MTNKTNRLVQATMASSGIDALILSESEIAMVLAMRSLPASISKTLIATTFSQADHYRQECRPRFQVINGGQRLCCEGVS